MEATNQLPPMVTNEVTARNILKWASQVNNQLEQASRCLREASLNLDLIVNAINFDLKYQPVRAQDANAGLHD